ncbi:U-box domain-containing protein 44-like isoform X2 [Abrus precatorius]|nr:U-box domain-containing protein 44-like isoform X2 [Abrus precatorius]
MQMVEFEASQAQLQIVDKLNQGLREQKHDQAFANDMLEEIARAVGVPVEPSEISKELASIRREKEEAANRKERAECIFLEQIIQLLSRADAARDYEEVERQYFERVKVIERYDSREKYIPPLNPFLCSITEAVMVDPVSLCTGTTCERSAIEAWLYDGKRIDPATKEVLEDTTLRSNIPLRQSIEEWRELNYCLIIRSIRENLLSNLDLQESLSQMQALIRENSINKDWISIGELTDIVISILGSSYDKDVTTKILIALKDVVEGHARNKEKVAESQGWDHIISCLGSDSSISKAAIDLLYELLQERSGWNKCFCKKLSENRTAVRFLITILKNTINDSAEVAEKILLELFEQNQETITTAANFGWYRPLVDCMIRGPDSRMLMVKAIVNLELNDLNLKLLGEEGSIPPLLEMLSGGIESKNLSLSALVKLAGSHANKGIIAASGGVPLILDLMFSPPTRTVIIIKCAEILEKLSSDGYGIDFFVDGDGKQLELDSIITNLLALQQNSNSGHNFRKPALRALLGICKFETGLVKKAILAANGVSLILPLLDDSDSEIRETAINLLFLFSQHEPEGIVEYLFRPRRLEALIGFLENEDNDNVRMAAAGLLANLPKSERELTMKLIDLGGLDAIISILKTGKMEAKENALSALFRFTDPTNIESQRDLVKRGIYPMLVNFLNTGSVTAKARAAAFIGDLSMSTPKLTVISKPTGCCFLRSSRVPLCSAHGSVCSVSTTFCLLEANALPGLIKLLHGEVHATAYEAIQTLSTLVLEDFPQRGARVLHDSNAIRPLLDILNWGTDSLKAEVLGLLERVFVSREMVDYYGTTARSRLIGLTGMNIYGDGHLRRKAAKVLSLLERYSKSSSSAISGVLE